METKLITCVVPRGLASHLIESLAQKLGVTSASAYSGRGASARRDVIQEVDVLSVPVADEKADEVFSYLYYEMEIDKHPGRLIYQETLDQTSSLDLLDHALLD
ncbi:hypothetical protein MTBLM1_60013 [Rhodospirillaceae bacterium LM-1]|nr:hypothetical protein MTBLM1_60013 [Rhodospirillaceae bacterium LM-1]